MNKIRVLLADDHAIIRDGIRQILEDSEDFLVAGEAANGIEVMQHIRAATCDLLVLDISMPGRNGIDLIRHVHDEKHDLPILILSMHQEEQYAVRALHAGASGYVTKESDSELLLAAMRRVAGGGVFVSEKVAEIMARGLHPISEVFPHTLLSDREFQVFEMLAQGLGLTEIANEFSLSVKTISTHKSRILQKMNFNNMADLIRYAITHKLVEQDDMA
ncbi:response regulator transcription factor [Dechloromonas sp. HYN0024]|uniref:response regulator n=1 Tax=Dechloromonas sp. HYN0024 TaxID=2231055 RepID=UPI000E43A183|nr:response regulator transcription factor [Dechloromonas sp. HYN0024]AXS80682.1 DNA-binding response regulator [Dechloromonas sp. HYN0024]